LAEIRSTVSIEGPTIGIVTVAGEVGGTDREVAALRAELQAMEGLEAQGVVVDLSGIELLPSRFVGALVFAVARAHRRGQVLVGVAPKGRAREHIELLGLTRTLPCFPTVDEAVQFIQEQPAEQP